MKLKYSFIVLLPLIHSCSIKNTAIIGNYKTTEPTIMEQGFKQLTYSSRIVGTVLTLNKDSTFYLKNCSQIITGGWKTKENSLLLYCNTKKFIIDSLNYAEKNSKYIVCDNTPYIYKISGTRLKQNSITNGNKMYERLKKIKVVE